MRWPLKALLLCAALLALAAVLFQFVYRRLHNRDDTSGKVLDASLKLLDDSGQVVADLEGLTGVRAAREAQGLTWYALAKRAGIPNPNTVRDIESGRDAKLSNVQAVAAVLGLRLELIEANV